MKYTAVLVTAVLMAACSGNDPLPAPTPTPEPEPKPEPKELQFTRFRFREVVNIYLIDRDIECTIDGDEITAHIRGEVDITRLKPTFEGVFDRVWVNESEQVSEATTQDFTNPVTYILTGSDGAERSYRVFLETAAGLPVVKIWTDGNTPVTSKDHFVPGRISISNISEFGGMLEDGVRLRVRGNATAGYEKKPYRIKLDNKAPLMGFPTHKDWILLAEYCDKSLLRTSYMWELSKLAGMDWTCRSKHVKLHLNGTYEGVYLLCENVTRDSGRANIAHDGFIIENDGYWGEEPVWFRTNAGLYYSFKYPDSDKDIVAGDDNYIYIRDFMNRLETALYSDDFTDPDRGYRQYIDAVSWARWYLVQEVLGNIDTNPYFVLPERGSKLKMYPLWDAEWSLGLASNGGAPPYGWEYPPVISPVEKLYWKNSGYFARLTSDPWFCRLLQDEWEQLKKKLPELKARIGVIADNLEYAQEINFTRWNILGRYVSVGLVAFATWEEEVDYAARFLDKRVEWFDRRIKEFPR